MILIFRVSTCVLRIMKILIKNLIKHYFLSFYTGCANYLRAIRWQATVVRLLNKNMLSTVSATSDLTVILDRWFATFS
jgi:hypothetical protein